MFEFLNLFYVFGAFVAFTLLVTWLALLLRRVVPTNEVHIVQSAKKTTSYGKDTGNGNSYYEWPSWIPVFGVTKVKLPMSVFNLDLDGYEAYDKGRLPFIVDVTAFFRISDSNVAAQRIHTYQELCEQLTIIVQGAVRKILANNELEEIMQGRSIFGEQFTKEIETQLIEFGVQTVKNIELMDIRDSQGSNVIKNIMEKKKSHIDMESRIEVAKNKQAAETAEILAKQEIDLRSQSAKQAVGLRTVETQREVALSEQTAVQAVKEQERTTKEKEMQVKRVQDVHTAEILRDVELVKAEQAAKTAVVGAQGFKEQTILKADGQLEASRREAEAITLNGNAKADAEKAMQLAPVQAQITLAKEIGSNKEYQQYLVTVRQIEAAQSIGVEQAKALEKASIKVIANSGSPNDGLTNVMDLFTSKGGTKVGQMLESLAQTDEGEKLLSKLTGTDNS
jgi:flotillin